MPTQFPKFFRSSDPGAPSCTGTAGALIALLDAILVNGYNAKSVATLTRSGTTATLTTATAHGLAVDDVILVAGADQGDYNGEARVTAVTSTTATFEVANSPATPATGTITVKKAGAGWSKAFSGTNLAAYQGSAGTGDYLRVDDTGTPGTAGARNAWVRGYETMSDVSTGTIPFPTVAQFANGLVWRKSGSTDGTVRPWFAVASDRFLLLAIAWDQTGVGTTTPFAVYYFGDLDSPVKSGDTGHCLIGGQTADALTNVHTSNNTLVGTVAACITGGQPNMGCGYLARRANAVTTSVLAYINSGDCQHLYASNYLTQANTLGGGQVGGTGMTPGYPYPSPVDNGLHVGQVEIADQDGPRGLLPLVIYPRHVAPLNNAELVTGISGLIGQKFHALRVGGSYFGGAGLTQTRSGDSPGQVLLRYA